MEEGWSVGCVVSLGRWGRWSVSLMERGLTKGSELRGLRPFAAKKTSDWTDCTGTDRHEARRASFYGGQAAYVQQARFLSTSFHEAKSPHAARSI